MIKVCFIVSSLANEGPVNIMYNIIKYMDFSVFQVSIVTLIPEKENSRIHDFKQFPISIHSLAGQGRSNPLSLFRRLKQCIQKINPAVLHAHCPRSLYLMCFLPRQYKRVYTIHIYPGLQQKALYGNVKGEIIIRLNHYFTRKADLPIGCSESVGSLYKKHKGWDIMSIPNGSSLPVWKRDEKRKQELREKFNLAKDVRYYIFIGRFSEEKNPDKLIQAFQEINDPQKGLILLGNGPMWDQLKKNESKQIILPGFTRDVYDYLIASDYYISASEVEGLANTLLESMTIGLPVLLSDIPSHNEVMSKMKKTVGYLFNPHDTNDLIDKIKKIEDSVNKETASLELQKVFEEYYTAKKMSLSYQREYTRLSLK